MSNWKELLERRDTGEASSQATPEMVDTIDPDLAAAPDLNEYRPWILQRGASRPALLVDLRRFEPRSGMLTGCQMSYPHLFCVEYIGDRMVTLDFGIRSFVIEGSGLSELPMRLQQGAVLAIQEYAATIWRTRPVGPVITRIIRLDATPKANVPGANSNANNQ